MAHYLEELNKEYIRLNHLAALVTDELDHKSLMERINLLDFYTSYYLNTKHIMDNNQH